jgi:ribosomal protein S18 acetylase RimI-like enzyme
MNYTFRKATPFDVNTIWSILQHAILRRKKDNSNQWQDGYPNERVVQNDIANEIGYVLTDADVIVGYCVILINDEPEYANLQGNWLTNSDFIVIHRLAISEDYLGKGLAKLILKNCEEIACKNTIYSVKVDTSYDNKAMLAIFKSLGYRYCGIVHFRGSPREAYEKVLSC